MINEQSIVFVVDDDASIRKALRRLLQTAGHCVQTFSGVENLFKDGRPSTPCCLLLDIQLTDCNGLEYQETLARAGIQVPIIFITGCGDIPMSVRAMKAGAIDFLAKPIEAAQLRACVNAALKFDAQSLPRQQQLHQAQSRFESLTLREREVFSAVVSGMLNKQVGYDLGVAEKTIKVHRGRVMEKMQATSLADLVRTATILSAATAGDGLAPMRCS
jgi:FixJ family two-component response regulator